MSVIMGTAARIEPGPKSFWGLNWLQNQDFGQSITKARSIIIVLNLEENLNNLGMA